MLRVLQRSADVGAARPLSCTAGAPRSSYVRRSPCMRVSATLAILAAATSALAYAQDSRIPVIVELFTSEGCSSCPPADALLARLEKNQPVAGAEVIPLALHVDYWNHLGWADPFSSHQFSERQGEYAAVFGNDSVYTPQMVVDGVREFNGSNSSLAQEAIAKAARESKGEV